MRWLTLRASVGTVALVLLISTVIALRRSPDVPTLAAWFTYADGSPCPMPCLFGIRPGVTPFSDVERLLDAHPLTRNRITDGPGIDQPDFGSINYTIRLPTMTLGSLFINHESAGRIHHISLIAYFAYPAHQPVTFETALLTFGLPQGVLLSGYSHPINTLFFYYRGTTILNVVDGNACLFPPTGIVVSIDVYGSSQDAPTMNYGMPNAPEFFPWAGFSRRTYYGLYYGPLGKSEIPCSE